MRITFKKIVISFNIYYNKKVNNNNNLIYIYILLGKSKLKFSKEIRLMSKINICILTLLRVYSSQQE
jgi:hypothetical protein